MTLGYGNINGATNSVSNDFIENFCVKTGLKEVFIQEKLVSADLVSESLKTDMHKADGRFKEHK